jgi:hypothetical protein
MMIFYGFLLLVRCIVVWLVLHIPSELTPFIVGTCQPILFCSFHVFAPFCLCIYHPVSKLDIKRELPYHPSPVKKNPESLRHLHRIHRNNAHPQIHLPQDVVDDKAILHQPLRTRKMPFSVWYQCVD